MYINTFGLECGTAGDAVVLRAELVYKGGAGSKAEDIARDWKPDAKSAAAAKAAVGGTKMWKTAFKDTAHASVREEGGPGSMVAFLDRKTAAMAVLQKHGLADSLKRGSDESSAWVGVKIKADPTGLAIKKMLEELRSACEKNDGGEEEEEEEEGEEEAETSAVAEKKKMKKKKKKKKGESDVTTVVSSS